MKKRLIHSQDISQLYQAVPLNFNEENDWRERGYSNYTNVVWVTPIEAQMIMQAFGPAYIESGAKEDSFYVTPKYLEPEVEAMIWRLRGTTPIEGNDRTTYAAMKKYECLKCNDTGKINGKKCECVDEGNTIKKAQNYAKSTPALIQDMITDVRRGIELSGYRTPEDNKAFLSSLLVKLTNIANTLNKPTQINASSATKLAGKCPTCKGKGWSFNKEENKKEKCKDCRATGEMTDAKRQRIIDNKKLKASHISPNLLDKKIRTQDDNGDIAEGIILEVFRENGIKLIKCFFPETGEVVELSENDPFEVIDESSPYEDEILKDMPLHYQAKTEKIAGKCPTCKGMKTIFDKENNKRQKCTDCRGTGQMTSQKRQRTIDDKKITEASKKRRLIQAKSLKEIKADDLRQEIKDYYDDDFMPEKAVRKLVDEHGALMADLNQEVQPTNKGNYFIDDVMDWLGY